MELWKHVAGEAVRTTLIHRQGAATMAPGFAQILLHMQIGMVFT